MPGIAEITDPTGGVYIPQPEDRAKDLFAHRMLELSSYQLINDETGNDSRLPTQERLDYIQDIFPYKLLAETTGADIYECQDLLIIVGTEVVSHNSITNALFFISETAQVKRGLPKSVSTLSSQGASFSRTKHEVADVANSLREFSGLDIESLARIFKVSRATYHRWLRGLPVSKRHRDYILEILPLLEEAAQRLGSPETVNAWLLTPLSSGGKKPIEYLAEKDLDLFRGFLLHQRTGKEQFHPLKPSRHVFKPRRLEEVEDVREQLRPHTWYDQDNDIAIQQPVVNAIRRLRSTDSLHDTLDNLREIRYLLLNEIEPYEVEMLFLFDGDSETPPLNDEEAARLANWMDKVLKSEGKAILYTWHAYSTQEISVYYYENSYELALHEFSLP